MTVCIAAICVFEKQPFIVAASDRMITAGDIEFEQPQPKIFQLGLHSVALTAGDVSAQSLIATRTQREILRSGITDIGEVAAIYGSEFMEYLRLSAEAAFLAPLGLNSETFIERQQTLKPEVATTLVNQLQDYRENYERDFGGAIVTGVDDSGAHIFVVEATGRPVSMDSIGFASIGFGRWHAGSQFMFSGYAKHWDFERALFLTYSAKRRAEVAPGVGLATDMVLISTNPRRINHLGDDNEIVLKLKEIYDRFVGSERELRRTSDEEVKAYAAERLFKKKEGTSKSDIVMTEQVDG